ncbi:CgeB family protein [Acaryochloris marina NIES-2412]|uniref:CgeB family protein n=1 Tax=Acaryochloris marina TaxID=155978 RepID=UPI004057FB6D
MDKIWYFGNSDPNSDSYLRFLTLIRIGYKVKLFDPYKRVDSWTYRIHYKTGFRIIQPFIKKWLINILKDINNPNLIWVDSGELLGYDCLNFLKSYKVPLVLFNNDDPTGNRDGQRFASLLNGIHFYDLCVVRRDVNELEYKAYGVQKTLRLWLSYDELIHRANTDKRIVSEDISFIGSYFRMENRDQFILELIKANLKVRVLGNGWHKSSRYRQLKSFCNSPVVGTAYSKVINSSYISLGLLSYGNRDIHTRRTLEIPACGGLLCAERTSEHQLLFEEGYEAVFWSSINECIEVCKYLLLHPEVNECIRRAGMKKVRQLGVGNEDICRHILANI